MGTSRSGNWTATAHLHSGRPDPAWTVPEQQAVELINKWQGLPTAASSSSPGSQLGYRGVSLAGPGEETWTAERGVVTKTHSGGHRKDAGREWERALLETAPQGLLPPVDLSDRSA